MSIPQYWDTAEPPPADIANILYAVGRRRCVNIEHVPVELSRACRLCLGENQRHMCVRNSPDFPNLLPDPRTKTWGLCSRFDKDTDGRGKRKCAWNQSTPYDTLMLKALGTCSESRSACLLTFSSFVSPPAETAFGARETCVRDQHREHDRGAPIGHADGGDLRVLRNGLPTGFDEIHVQGRIAPMHCFRVWSP